MKIDIATLLTLIKQKRIVRNRCLSDGDYNGVDISYLRADKLTIEHANMRHANLSSGQWRSCTLNDVKLDNLNAHNALLRLCTLEQVSAKEASFDHAVLENCKADGCIFDFSDFNEASITDSDFNRASFASANMNDTDASYCNMRGADFRKAKLVNTNFRDADLRGADFTGALLDKVDFTGANTEGALFDPHMTRETEDQSSVQQGDVGDLVGAVSPIVSKLLKKGGDKGLLNEPDMSAELVRIMAAFKTSQVDKADAVFDKKIDDVLNQAGDIGLVPLMKSLQQEGGEPPLAVKKMIEGMMKDFDLGEGATTEDLLTSLVETLEAKSVKKPVKKQ